MAVAAISSLEDEEFNDKTRNAGGRVEAAKADFFLLGAMTKNTLLAMEQKFLRDTWSLWGDSEKVAIIDTLTKLVEIDQAAEQAKGRSKP